MKIGDLFSGDFINAKMIGDDRPTLTIASVDMVEMGNDGPKPAIRFKATEKMLPLNKTNAETLAESYGEETEAWAGKPVTLFTRQVEFRGKMVPGVRVSVPSDDGADHVEDDGDPSLPF